MDWKVKYGLVSPSSDNNVQPSTDNGNVSNSQQNWKVKYGLITPQEPISAPVNNLQPQTNQITSPTTTTVSSTPETTPSVTLEKQKSYETTPTEKFTIAGAEPKYIFSELGKQLKETSLMDWTKGLGTAIYGIEQTFLPTKIINALDHHFHITERLNKLSPLVKTGIELTNPAVFGIMEEQRAMEKVGAKEALEAHPVAKELSGLAGDLGNMILANAILPNPAEAIKSSILKNAPEPIKLFLLTNPRYGATILRYLSQAPRAVGMFGGLNFLKEATDQIDKGEFSPTKLISQTLKGGGWGLAATFPTILPTYPLRITGGVATGAVWASFETLVKNKQITKEDIPSIATNAILTGAFQALTTKGLTRSYEQIYLDDVGHYLNVNKYGEEVANLLGRLNYQAIVNRGTPIGDLYASARDKIVAEIGLHNDVDYIIKDNQIKIVNPDTGRIEEGKEYFPGIKNALELKEGIQIHPQEQSTGIKPIGQERSLSEILNPSEKFLIEHLAETSGKVPIMDLKLLEPNPQVQEFQIKYPDIITRIDLQLGHTVPSNTIIDEIQNFPSSLVTPISPIAPELSKLGQIPKVNIGEKVKPEAKPVTPEVKPITPINQSQAPETQQPQKTQETQSIPKELEPLAEEARKYKSAEEFISHIKNKIDISFTKEEPSSPILENVFKTLSPNEQQELFTRMPSRRVYDRWLRKTAIEDMALNPEAKLITKELPTTKLLEKGQEIPVINISGNNIPLSKTELKYYQAIKSKLTDFYNQATKGTPEVPKSETKPIQKDLESLAEEARKYSSAEEFAKFAANKYRIYAQPNKNLQDVLKDYRKNLTNAQNELTQYQEALKYVGIAPLSLSRKTILGRIDYAKSEIKNWQPRVELLEKITKQANTFADFYNQATKGITEVKSEVKPTEEIKTTPAKVLKTTTKFIRNKNLDNKIFDIVRPFTAPRSSLEILKNIAIDGNKIMATDLDKAIVYKTDKNIGKVVLNADTLKGQNINDIKIIDEKNNKVQVGKLLVDGIPFEDYPVLPDIQESPSVTVSSDDLIKGFSKTVYAVDKDERRPSLSGVLLTNEDNKLLMTGTDSFRLSQIYLPAHVSQDFKIIIPEDSVKAILKTLKSVNPDNVSIAVSSDKRSAKLSSGNFEILTRLIEEKFPEYKSVFPKEVKHQFAVNREQLLSIIKQVPKNKLNEVRFELDPQNKILNITSKTDNDAIFKDSIPITIQNPSVVDENQDANLVMPILSDDTDTTQDKIIAFKKNFLEDILKNMDSEYAQIRLNDAKNPMVITEMQENELKAPSGMASIGRFADNTEIKIGHLNSIRPIEFPELVELATELTKGNVPEIKRSLGKALGKFVAINSGRIKLTADLFRKGNEEQLAKALAHEIGHLIDYLPERTLKRGNLLGSLLTLQHFLKNQYGSVEITNKEIREELKAVSKYWRPWDENNVPKSFANYRNSARELYADAISVLFNSPGTLEEMAPNFYYSFFDYLDQKPDVKKAYFDLQEILSHDRETLIQLRRQRIQQMFDEADYKAEELQKIKEQEKKLRFRDFWNYFTYSVKSINQPVYNKVNELRKKGVYISDDENPEYLLSGRNYLAGRIKAEIDTNVQPIMKDLFNHNIDWKTFGEFLYYERIIDGDRSEFANPKGITPQAAEELRNNIKETLGDRYPILEKNADKFRQFLKDLAKEAYDVGLYSSDMFDIINGNSKYVPFQVVEYMDNYVNWRTKSQVGTLKDINNPANSLILKAISTIKAIENQKVRQATIKMLEKHFPDEIKDADTRFNGRIKVPIESRDSKFKLVTYYENGKLKGKYVDPYIAASLDKDSIAQNKAVMTVLSPIKKLNQKVFRPLFVVYNPGWIPFNFIRDFMRLWKNTPGLTWGKMVKLYLKAFRPAKVRAFGANENNILDKQAEALITKLEKEGVLSITWNDIMLGQETEDAQIQAILKRIGLAETDKEIPAINKNIDKVLTYTGIKKIADWIKKTGELVETLPKVAAYYELENKMSPNEMRTFIRRNAGSPDFLEKGYLTAATNDIFLFSNAIIQAISSDADIAIDFKTRSGFWWKTAKSIFLPKLLMFLALAGVFGIKIKKMMQDVSEYDLTNYIIIPIGRDTKNTKTVYLRIPTDETGRFLGAIFWKLLNSYSNDETVMQDIGDIASLFGGQLPSLTPSIEIPLTTAQFLSGKNPYDSFRNRQVLTDQQFKAGGWYALKPFLLWQFEQAGGNIFMKFYAGEQTPTTKTPGERFLQSPIISNVLGRFIKVSDYGEIERYRRKTGLIEQKKARENIDETKIINKYVQEYQKTKKNPIVLSREMTKEILGHNPRGQEEIQKAKSLQKKLKIAIERGKSDPKINALISANTNDEKEALLRVFKEDMDESEFSQFKKEILRYKIVSPEVLRKLNRPIKK